MTTRLNPYLMFRDTAREAMTFYQSVFGGELTLNTFGDTKASEDPADQDKIMHGLLLTDGGLCLMGADTPASMEQPTPGSSISVSLSGDDVEALRGYYDKLSASGSVTVPMELAPWGDYFGMCVDGYGVDWLVDASAPAS
jgi:PhnB protein